VKFSPSNAKRQGIIVQTINKSMRIKTSQIILYEWSCGMTHFGSTISFVMADDL